MRMYLVDNGNGVRVPVCEMCYQGNHITMCGFSHLKGDPDRSDCKNVGKVDNSDIIVQCCCGIEGIKLEKEA